MLKRESGAESNGKLPHQLIPSKTVTLFPEFALEDLPLGRTAALEPDFTVKYLPLGRILMMILGDFHQYDYSYIIFYAIASLILKKKPSPPLVILIGESWAARQVT